MNRGDALVFCTLEMSIFELISEGQLMVWIRQIESENETFLKTIFPWKFWVANFMDKLFLARKKCLVSANVKLTAFIM
jgi:hypothetical protein